MPNTDMHHHTSIGFGNLGAAATAPLSGNSILLIFTIYQGKDLKNPTFFLDKKCYNTPKKMGSGEAPRARNNQH